MWYHYTIARYGRMPLFDDVDDVHRTLHIITRCTGSTLLLFGLADDHLHLVMRGSRAELGQRVGNLQQRLRRSYRKRHRTNAGTEPARVKAVNGRSHLRWLVRYVIRQPDHHATRLPVPDWQATCFPDLVGARTLPGFDPDRIRRALPRLTDADVWRTVDLSVVRPVKPDGLDRFGAAEIIRSAGAAYAAGRTLQGRRPEIVAAREVALTLLDEAGLSPRRAAEAVGCDIRSAYRQRARGAPASALGAARLHLAITAALPNGLKR